MSFWLLFCCALEFPSTIVENGPRGTPSSIVENWLSFCSDFERRDRTAKNFRYDLHLLESSFDCLLPCPNSDLNVVMETIIIAMAASLKFQKSSQMRSSTPCPVSPPGNLLNEARMTAISIITVERQRIPPSASFCLSGIRKSRKRRNGIEMTVVEVC